MFSFHKPKVYRSTSGCCICKAKSSSSRFTDSAKYEDDLVECFKLGERRKGEICNACVLLVKRFKKLPVGSDRHWRHVVDYRATPGSKSLARSKTRSKKRPKLKAEARAASPDADADDDLTSDLSVLSVLSGPNSPTEPIVVAKPSRKRSYVPTQRKEADTASSGLVDLTFWKRKRVCCGIIFTGPGSLVIIDPRLLTPCCGSCGAKRGPTQTLKDEGSLPISVRCESTQPITSEDASASPPTTDEHVPSDQVVGGSTTISDSSSDSGYDECSNPAVPVAVN